MAINRIGNKSRIADKIIKHFPEHTIYVELFFGAGGLFFNKKRAKYNILNDLDDDVFNYWQVLQNNKDELLDMLEMMPISETLMKYWSKNKESDPIKKALRFLFLSNFGLMGKPETLRFEPSNQKKVIIEKALRDISNCQFMCADFRAALAKLGSWAKKDTLIYCDPPYLETTNNYQSGFSEQDARDLFNMLNNSGIKFAISEFDHPLILELASQYNLNVIEIGERCNLGNRRTEILIINYQSPAAISLFSE